MKITYDPECEKLARFFLEDEALPGYEPEVQDLAGQIQLAIENWLEARNERLQAEEDDDEGEDESGQGEEKT